MKEKGAIKSPFLLKSKTKMSNLVIKTLGNTNIQVNSSVDFPTLTQNDRVCVKLSKNCCPVGSEVCFTVPATKTILTTTNFLSGVTLTEFTFQDLSTGLITTFPLSSIAVTDCASISGVITAINAAMTSIYGSAAYDYTASCSVSGSTLSYHLTSNNGKTVGLYLSYTVGTSLTVQLAYLIPDTAAYISPYGLIVSPYMMWTTDNPVYTFDDGVYTIETLTSVVGQDIDTVDQKGCVFMNTTTQCKMANVITSATDKQAVLLTFYYYGLVFTESCMCDCDYLCKLYNSLIELITLISSSTSFVNNDCGCS